MIRTREKRRGVALLLTALICLAMVPLVGLAIDGANAYLLRAQISAALDGAVLAGARSLSGNFAIDDQRKNADAVAKEVFAASLSNLSPNIRSIVHATFCVGSWDGTGADSNCAVQGAVPSGGGYRWLNGAATASLPLSMLSVIPGIKPAPLNVTASAQRRNVNLMLVLDYSFAIQSVIGNLQADATDFVNMFANNRDSMGFIAFSGSPVVAYPISTTFLSDANNIPSLINSPQFAPYPLGSANAAAAIWAAYQQLLTANPGSLNVIVFFTGGVPTSFSANFAGLVNTGCQAMSNPLNAIILTDPYVYNYMFGLSSPVDIATGTVSAGDLGYNFEVQAPPTTNNCTTSPLLYESTFNILTSLPTSDLNGNSTNGTGSISAYNPGLNMGQVDGPTISAAAENAFDDAANKIRGSAVAPVIYTISLLGLPETPPDGVLLARIANDPASPSYNVGQPAGAYLSSPTTDQLNAVFSQVASEVLKLAK